MAVIKKNGIGMGRGRPVTRSLHWGQGCGNYRSKVINYNYNYFKFLLLNYNFNYQLHL